MMIKVYKKFFLMLGVTVLLCLSASIVWSETMDDLVKRKGIYYKKFSDIPFTGNIDGKWKGSIKNGKKNGFWVIYYQNGQLKSKGNWINGRRDGPWVEYYSNGQLEGKGSWENGKREGLTVYYHKNGYINFKGNHKNGKKEGSWIGQTSDGRTFWSFTGTFKNGIKISD